MRSANFEPSCPFPPCVLTVHRPHEVRVADASTLGSDAPWTARIGGIRANASTMSHAELDAATELDSGNPAELAEQYRRLRSDHPHLHVLGGCCGTNHRHIDAIATACLAEVRC